MFHECASPEKCKHGALRCWRRGEVVFQGLPGFSGWCFGSGFGNTLGRLAAVFAELVFLDTPVHFVELTEFPENLSGLFHDSFLMSI